MPFRIPSSSKITAREKPRDKPALETKAPEKRRTAWPIETTDRERHLIEKYAEYTMTGRYRPWTLLRAVEYIDCNEIPGDIVECGVWRGGLMMMVKEARSASNVARSLYLFDTFTGMPEPIQLDVNYRGESAQEKYAERRKSDHTNWAYASLDEVRSNFLRFNLDLQNVFFVAGKVEDTLRDESNLPKQIAILRLDTDFYESTKAELEILYPRLVPGGILIVDDYGHWLGAKRAVDEYFSDRRPLLLPVDYSCRMAVKPVSD
ncbi:MAG: class I SAM-dependent methyltransferase [Bradyrhizobiaceae bacterium]|nr:class I SAM-dependent methyltransferase [Bradyrhizobiaceae bacterium]